MLTYRLYGEKGKTMRIKHMEHFYHNIDPEDEEVLIIIRH